MAGPRGPRVYREGHDMTTPRNRAIYFAKQAFAHMSLNGRDSGLIRLDTEDGARWSFTHAESGFVVILKHAADYRERGGAVDAARTRDANAGNCLCLICCKGFDMGPHDVQICPACYPQEREDAIARLAAAPAEEPAPVDPAAGLDMGVELITEARPVRIAGGIAESGMAEEPAPAAVRYIDATPTWAAILPALLAAVTDGTAEGQRIARAELVRMARAADSAVAAAKAEEEKAEERGPVDPTAEHIAQDMARRAVAAALQEEDGTARRTYTTDSGLLVVRASFDGDSVVVAWAVDGRPLSRAAAESLIAARVARVSVI